MSQRFQRQIDFSPLNSEGQRRLAAGKVLLVGCGALGGTVADLLVRAGVGCDTNGQITLFDFDVVQMGNLHRQTLFTEADAVQSRLKVEAAKERLKATNSAANMEIFAQRFDEQEIFRAEFFDVLIDATDNVATRFVLNAAAFQFGKPLISAGVSGASGQILTVFPKKTACLACLFNAELPEPPAPPVLGPVPYILASMQALEAIKILSGQLSAVSSTLRWFDFWTWQWKEMPLHRNAHCNVCS